MMKIYNRRMYAVFELEKRSWGLLSHKSKTENETHINLLEPCFRSWIATANWDQAQDFFQMLDWFELILILVGRGDSSLGFYWFQFQFQTYVETNLYSPPSRYLFRTVFANINVFLIRYFVAHWWHVISLIFEFFLCIFVVWIVNCAYTLQVHLCKLKLCEIVLRRNVLDSKLFLNFCSFDLNYEREWKQ